MYRILQLLISDKVLVSIKQLYPKWEVEGRIIKYYLSKLKNCFYIVMVGVLLCVLISLSDKSKTFDDELRIKRNGYGEGEKIITLRYKAEGINDYEDIEINVPEKRYGENETEELLERFRNTFIETVLDENESQDHVTKNLKFKNTYEGYPFSVSFQTDKPLLINSSGVIDFEYMKEKEIEDGINVKIKATVSYFDYFEDISFFVSVYMPSPSSNQRVREAVEMAIEKENMNTLTEDYFRLPASVLGKDIIYYEQKDTTPVFILILFIIAAFAVFFSKDKDLEKEVEKRTKDFEDEYPRIIKKFALFYNAGMPVKSIWIKLCDDYLDALENGEKKNCVYEEMLITKLQMADGVREIDAYEAFANRVGMARYRVFISLLEQAVKVGKKELFKALKTECDDAFLEKKNNAKKLLEEAGTKMLIPMFMMLLVVIIIILFPAFYSFNI